MLAGAALAAQTTRFAQRVCLTVPAAATRAHCRVLCATFRPGVVADFVLCAYSDAPFDIVPSDDDGDDDDYHEDDDDYYDEL